MISHAMWLYNNVGMLQRLDRLALSQPHGFMLD